MMENSESEMLQGFPAYSRSFQVNDSNSDNSIWPTLTAAGISLDTSMCLHGILAMYGCILWEISFKFKEFKVPKGLLSSLWKEIYCLHICFLLLHLCSA